MIACKKNEVDFSFSPTAPRAGQSVSFSNLSTSGEEWAWSFGDGVSSTLKSPSHTYKKPGKYVVSLKVDNKNAWRVAKEITIYDTVPTFVCTDTVFAIYQDYTFTANLYNPYNYEVKYLWYQPLDEAMFLPPYFEVTDTTLTGSTLHLYFTYPMEEAKLGLCIILNDDTTFIEKSLHVLDRATNSLLLRTTDADWRQRIFGKRAEEAMPDLTATALLDAEQDTIQTYNGYTFRLSELRTVFPELEGFHIANRKFYYRTVDNGLWLANIDGSFPVQIDSLDCQAMTLDLTDNRIYWANSLGVWYMPFVGSDNNQFVTEPTLLNIMDNVTKLAADAELK